MARGGGEVRRGNVLRRRNIIGLAHLPLEAEMHDLEVDASHYMYVSRSPLPGEPALRARLETVNQRPDYR